MDRAEAPVRLRGAVTGPGNPPARPFSKPQPDTFTYDKRKQHFGKCDQWTCNVQVTGGGNSTVAAARDAMGIPWMTKNELNEAIPPAYAREFAPQIAAGRAELQSLPQSL